MEQEFYIFGSCSSVDFDVLVLVDKIPEIYTAHEWCTEFSEKLGPILGNQKKVNINLGVFEDGIITKVFKGTPDEVNNSVFQTYSLHRQWYELKINRLVPRNKNQKILRVARIVLSFLSRSVHRKRVKEAMKGDFLLKLRVLNSIDFSSLSDLGNKNVTMIDFKKVCAFQFGQVLGLMQDVELYTKEDIANLFPDLRDCLYRIPGAGMEILEFYKNQFVEWAQIGVPKMKKLVE